MSNGHSTEAAALPISTAALFAPADEIPKLLRDFPTATPSMYETYLVSWWKRKEKFNTFVALCKYFYGDAIGDNDVAHILPLVAEAIGSARKSMMEDFAVLEGKLRLGTLEDEAGELAGVGGSSVVAVPEEPVFEAEEAAVMEVEEADIPGAEN